MLDCGGWDDDDGLKASGWGVLRSVGSSDVAALEQSPRSSKRDGASGSGLEDAPGPGISGGDGVGGAEETNGSEPGVEPPCGSEAEAGR